MGGEKTTQKTTRVDDLYEKVSKKELPTTCSSLCVRPCTGTCTVSGQCAITRLLFLDCGSKTWRQVSSWWATRRGASRKQSRPSGPDDASSKQLLAYPPACQLVQMTHCALLITATRPMGLLHNCAAVQKKKRNSSLERRKAATVGAHLSFPFPMRSSVERDTITAYYDRRSLPTDLTARFFDVFIMGRQ